MFSSVIGFSQQKTENLIIVTLDGLRWQEVFKGADKELINDTVYNRDVKEMNQKFQQLLFFILVLS